MSNPFGFGLVDSDGFLMRWSYPSPDPAIYADRESAERAADGCRVVPVFAEEEVRYAPLKGSIPKESKP